MYNILMLLALKILYIDCTVHLYCTGVSGSDGSDRGVNGCAALAGGDHSPSVTTGGSHRD